MIYGSTVSQLHSTVFSRERQSFLFVRHKWNDDSFSLDEKSLFPIRSKTNKISNNRTNGIGLLLYFYFGLLIVLTRQRFASLLTSIVPTLTVNNNETKIIISFLRSFAKTNYFLSLSIDLWRLKNSHTEQKVIFLNQARKKVSEIFFFHLKAMPTKFLFFIRFRGSRIINVDTTIWRFQSNYGEAVWNIEKSDKILVKTAPN